VQHFRTFQDWHFVLFWIVVTVMLEVLLNLNYLTRALFKKKILNVSEIKFMEEYNIGVPEFFIGF